MIIRPLLESVGRVVGWSLFWSAVFFLVSAVWLLGVGESWIPPPATFGAALFVLFVLGCVAWLAFPSKPEHEKFMGDSRPRRLLAVLVLAVLSPILAHQVGGWFDEHKYWFLLLIPTAGFGVSLLCFAWRYADKLPPGSSSTRLS